MLVIVIVLSMITIIYLYDLPISPQQSNVLIISTLGLLIFGASYGAFHFTGKTEKKNQEPEEKAFEYVKTWWKNKTNEDLTYRDSKFGETIQGQELIYGGILSRKHGLQPLLVIVGTKPWRIADWDENPDDEIIEKFWEIFSPILSRASPYVGKPSTTVTPDDMVRGRTPSKIGTQIKIGEEKRIRWDELKSKKEEY